MKRSLFPCLLAASCAVPCRAADDVKLDSFNAGGVKISFGTRGAGQPVVLIHGWLASHALNWDLPGITADLAKDFRIIEMDVRGHGRSDKPTKEDQYGEQLVEVWIWRAGLAVRPPFLKLEERRH